MYSPPCTGGNYEYSRRRSCAHELVIWPRLLMVHSAEHDDTRASPLRHAINAMRVFASELKFRWLPHTRTTHPLLERGTTADSLDGAETAQRRLRPHLIVQSTADHLMEKITTFRGWESAPFLFMNIVLPCSLVDEGGILQLPWQRPACTCQRKLQFVATALIFCHCHSQSMTGAERRLTNFMGTSALSIFDTMLVQLKAGSQM